MSQGLFPHMAVPRLWVFVIDLWSCQPGPWTPWVRVVPSRFPCPKLGGWGAEQGSLGVTSGSEPSLGALRPINQGFSP